MELGTPMEVAEYIYFKCRLSLLRSAQTFVINFPKDKKTSWATKKRGKTKRKKDMTLQRNL